LAARGERVVKIKRHSLEVNTTGFGRFEPNCAAESAAVAVKLNTDEVEGPSSADSTRAAVTPRDGGVGEIKRSCCLNVRKAGGAAGAVCSGQTDDADDGGLVGDAKGSVEV
jgi:hypothetical protein